MGGTAIERRLWRIRHVELDCSRCIVSTQLGCKAQGTINAGRDAGGKNPAAVQHDAFVDRSRTEERQQMKRTWPRKAAMSLNDPEPTC